MRRADGALRAGQNDGEVPCVWALMRRRTALFGLLAVGLGCSTETATPRRAVSKRRKQPREEPGPPPPANPPGTKIALDALEERARAMRARLDGRGFTVLVEAPFVVAGDEAADKVESRAATTIRWSVKLLKQQYFAADPRDIVEVYLFRDASSYYQHAKVLFDDEPETPYGYYTPDHGALLMNIASGGGTLVHEIVHPFMAANFPGCPTWFNEGLASLYEQCEDRHGEIVGKTNWRLPALQEAIREGGMASLSELLATTSEEFYEVYRSGLNYAKARYLCYYLQERELLRNFYHQFLATRAGDPTGRVLLQQTVGYMDFAQFEKDWRDFVMTLQYG